MIKNNFTKVFEKARSENRAALFIFATGYHPNYETSKLIIKEILKYADAVEIGNPFNTSTADSSVIMNASEVAIAAGANTKKILNLIKEIKSENTNATLACMGYLNPLYGYGIKRFAKECLADSCIIVDSSLDCPEEQELFEELNKKGNGSIVKIVTPQNDEDYIRACLARSLNWIYVTGYSGVTGSKKYNIDSIKKSVALIRKNSKNTFIGCGFGIKTKDDVAEVAKHVDAVICGTSIVDLIDKEHKKGSNAIELSKKVGQYVKELKKGLTK
ncbi:MAG: tryptophan synthase subunit alpha [Pelagibacterales bacterium]|nr:tryptophan synthase subunit alpha [Pelagibacterales bacterium]